MKYDKFKRSIIYGRSLYKRMCQDEDLGDELASLIRSLSQDDVVYSLLFLWVCQRNNEVYTWSTYHLYEVVEAHLEQPELSIWDLEVVNL